MRRSWDEPADDGLDEPVAITARQLRSLNRGVRFGFFALILALVAAGAAGWTAFRVAKQGTGTSASAPAAAQPHTADGSLADASTGTTASDAPTSASTAPSQAASAPAPQSAAHTSGTAPKATRAAKTEVAVAKSSKRTHAAAATRESKPVTEGFEPAPAAPAGVAPPSSVPMPVTAEPAAKPAARDSSAAH